MFTSQMEMHYDPCSINPLSCS
uniref:Uncharacterized protein n=1 Tax=Rhizophora mucronata TaxID=61149 RepID=A0A2P2QCI6_RHIMU